jgi:carboxylesterase type B
MLIYQGLIFFVVSVICQVIVGDQAGVVDIENGKIRGELRDFFYAFEGIPYAAPPVGKNRFQPPKPFEERWDEVRDFFKYGSSCMQWDHLMPADNRLRGSEDCLFLNVYVPKSVLESRDAKVPTFFHIHGGAFMFGGGEAYSPLRFMTREVILVTFNYRLGPLGFLSTEDEVIPGNFGMKDQLLALQWVNRNIESFQGDKREVTIIGFSAGGASVHAHYLSPLSKGLFKNGISFSGCALNPWVITERPKEKAYRVADLVGCQHKKLIDHKKLLNCLREKSAEDIVRAVDVFQPFLYNPFTPFGIVVEKHGDRFLPDLPSNLLQAQNYQKIPWLATATLDEGLYPAGELYNDEYLKTIDKDWSQLAPHLFDYNWTFVGNQEKDSISHRIRKEYLEDKDTCLRVCKEHFSRLRDIFSDRLYNYGIRKALFLQAHSSPTFFYLFDHKISFGIGEMLSGQTDVNLGIKFFGKPLRIHFEI